MEEVALGSLKPTPMLECLWVLPQYKNRTLKVKWYIQMYNLGQCISSKHKVVLVNNGNKQHLLTDLGDRNFIGRTDANEVFN